MNRNFVSLAFASAAFFLAAASPAAASPLAEPFSVRVSVADLDLASEEGRQALRKRMRYMATLTCASLPGAYEPQSLRACRQAFDDAAYAVLTRATVGS